MSLLLLPLWLLPLAGGSQGAEPMFTAVTNSVLPPDYDSNPTQLNYGVAVTDVDHDGDFEIVVAGGMKYALKSKALHRDRCKGLSGFLSFCLFSGPSLRGMLTQ
ncbi:Cartilage acidic protein 1 [Microtus ochrogaster]|uniref:Cartilage acidic protein 1 n=1 Tax=Microtus ochrogaster TaxID=79684 RepID=A0A8J6G6Z3_MICOH|nr:Cartilage acidic protein 1 [Microtus ochrogaster]